MFALADGVGLDAEDLVHTVAGLLDLDALGRVVLQLPHDPRRHVEDHRVDALRAWKSCVTIVSHQQELDFETTQNPPPPFFARFF